MQEEIAEGAAQSDQSVVSESASVLTLHFSQQETLLSPSETLKTISKGKSLIEKEDEEESLGKDFRFTPAKNRSIDRPQSAPPRPLTEIEEFQESNEYALLGYAAASAGELHQKEDGKYDLDSSTGNDLCKKFLGYLEELAASLKVRPMNRSFRRRFSQAYKVLYQEGSLCYLTEILDSAQEGKLTVPPIRLPIHSS